MKKLLLTVAAIPALILASDATAQTRAQVRGEIGIENRIANIQTRIDAGMQAGVIDRNEARQLNRQLRDLRMLEASYSRDGLNRQERMMLQQRIRALSSDVRLAGGTGWANRYGWNDNDWDSERYGYDDRRYGDRMYESDRYGNRTYETDRYGNRVGDVYDGRGGPYDPVANERPSLGTVIGNLLNGRRLNSVPREYSTQYRDRSDVYFRSDGQQVYEIDARTNRVIRIHPIR